MIKINYELLKEDASELRDLSEKLSELIEEVNSAYKYLEDSFTERVFPEQIEQLSIMIDELEEFGTEDLKQIAMAIDGFAEEFKELDKMLGKRE